MSDRQRIRAARRKAAKLFMDQRQPMTPRKERRDIAHMLAKRKVPPASVNQTPH